jgi:muramoyltetrapeptide carboxypeptidase
MGYRLSFPIDPSAFYGNYDHQFSNGSAADRVEALHQLLADESVAVILTARGGYGSMEMLPLLDFELVASSNKPIVGMSDACTLLSPWVEQAGVCSIHGPGLGTAFADYEEKEDARISADSLIRLLSDPSYRYQAHGHVVREGEGRGRIIASNLSILTSLLGTPWEIDTEGAVLVLEEVGSRPFQVHRSLLQLALAGKLAGLAALVFGRFSRCESEHGPNVAEVIDSATCSMLGETRYPIIRDMPFGHWGENQALALGAEAGVENSLFSLSNSPLLLDE